MLPLPVFVFIRYIAAGLVLALAGCRSSAVVPRFAPAAGGYHPRPVQRFDTATAGAAHQFPTALQRRVKADVPLQAPDTLEYPTQEKRERASQLNGSSPKATIGDTASSSTRPMAPGAKQPPAPTKFLSAQSLVHYGLHFLFPVVLALVFFPAVWQTAYLIMLATMLMDLDHLLAKPIFDPMRCSVGYHPLHSFYVIPVYVLLLLLPATQIVAVGVLFHLVTDTVDCFWNFSHCHECYVNSRLYALRNGVRKLLGRKVDD
ncbi:DUF6122 family protein [Hymenobacter persicinus]|uniref:DUF6122 family protein n=1 Tax=Hymenobacter persicinus TaxID=2025506 RepID=UPI001A91DD3B|nr:DUF6122 family protein [Hymenobacter persicinus]